MFQLVAALIVAAFLGGGFTGFKFAYDHYKVKDLKERIVGLKTQKEQRERAEKARDDQEEKAVSFNKHQDNVDKELKQEEVTSNGPWNTTVTINSNAVCVPADRMRIIRKRQEYRE